MANAGKCRLMASPAAFGRLCVETVVVIDEAQNIFPQPPSGGCVLKQYHDNLPLNYESQPPSGGCVLKLCFMPCYDY